MSYFKIGSKLNENKHRQITNRDKIQSKNLGIYFRNTKRISIHQLLQVFYIKTSTNSSLTGPLILVIYFVDNFHI